MLLRAALIACLLTACAGPYINFRGADNLWVWVSVDDQLATRLVPSEERERALRILDHCTWLRTPDDGRRVAPYVFEVGDPAVLGQLTESRLMLATDRGAFACGISNSDADFFRSLYQGRPYDGGGA